MIQARSLAVGLLSVVSALTAGPAAADDGAVTLTAEALAADLADHPDAQAEDIYKFLHQALFGPGHAVSDRTAAMDALARDIEGLGPPLPGEEPCRLLGGALRLIRVNLRPFVAGGGDPGKLLDAFVATAGDVHSEPRQMDETIEVVAKWLRSDDRKQLAGDLERLGRKLAEKGYPAIHHSETYREAYSPAYRVVSAERAAAHGWCE